MAFMNQERKKSLAPKIKEILKKYGLKGSLSVNNYSTLVLTIKSGKVDFIENRINCIDEVIKNRGFDEYELDCLKSNRAIIEKNKNFNVNVYWINEEYYGKSTSILKELHDAMMVGNHDNSDVQTDYFDIGWYTDIQIGSYGKPYVLEA